MTSKFTDSSIPSLTEKVAIVTGANSGLGFETSRILAKHGARVIMACRDLRKAEEAANEIRRNHPEANVVIKKLNLGEIASIEDFTREFLAQDNRLDILINNAGLMAINEAKTADGFEMQFGVNHLGHFALTTLLAPILIKTADSRVVSLSSSAHRAGTIHFGDLMYENREYSRWGAYAQSKLANLLFTLELNRRLKATSSAIALAAHPGVAKTNLGQNGGGVIGVGFRLTAPLIAHSALKGAFPAIRAATDPSATGGQYYGPRYGMFGDPVIETPSAAARDTETARHLWEVSESLTGKYFPSY